MDWGGYRGLATMVVSQVRFHGPTCAFPGLILNQTMDGGIAQLAGCAGLKIQWEKSPCGFDSRCPHQE